MKRTETTSARIARIAAKILAVKEPLSDVVFWHQKGGRFVPGRIAWADILALAGSVLTQAPSKPKKRAKPNGRVKVGPWKYRRRGVVKG